MDNKTEVQRAEFLAQYQVNDDWTHVQVFGLQMPGISQRHLTFFTDVR